MSKRSRSSVFRSVKRVIRQEPDCVDLTLEPALVAPFVCRICSDVFGHATSLSRHMKTVHGDRQWVCSICSRLFIRRDILIRHHKICGPTLKTVSYSCSLCPDYFATAALRDVHTKTHVEPAKLVQLHQLEDPTPTNELNHPPSAANPPSGCQSALNRNVLRTRVEGTSRDVDVLTFLRAQDHRDRIERALEEKKGVKFFISLNMKLRRPRDWLTRDSDASFPFYTSRCMRVLPVSDIDLLLEQAYAKTLEDLAKWLKEGSGWIIEHVNFVDLHIVTYAPLGGSSYLELPPRIYFSQSCVNVKNRDNKCFLWSVLSALHPVEKNSECVLQYQPYEHSLEVGDLVFPMIPDYIPNFEKVNGLRINLFGYEEKKVFPIYISEEPGVPINLLLFSGEGIQHYVWVKDITQLLFFMNCLLEDEHVSTDDDDE